MAKRENSVYEISLNPGCILAFAFAGDVGTVTLDIPAFFGGLWDGMTETQREACINGLRQKIADRAAIGRDPETGESATPEEKFEAMQECAERLAAGGPWNSPRETSGESGGLLYRAMRQLYPQAWGNRAEFADYLKRTAEERKVKVSAVRKSLMDVKAVRKAMDSLRTPGDAELGKELMQALENTK